MNEPNELRELDAWIGMHVFNLPPEIVARAVDPKTGGTVLWENNFFTRKNIEAFCAERPEYEFVLAEVWPNFTAEPASSMVILKMIGEKSAVTIRQQDGGMWCIWNHESHMLEDTFELAICRFAKKLFSK